MNIKIEPPQLPKLVQMANRFYKLKDLAIPVEDRGNDAFEKIDESRENLEPYKGLIIDYFA